MAGHEGREVRLHTDRAHAGAAAAVRDAERLVQVQVAHVSANVARRREADLQQPCARAQLPQSCSGPHSVLCNLSRAAAATEKVAIAQCAGQLSFVRVQ